MIWPKCNLNRPGKPTNKILQKSGLLVVVTFLLLIISLSMPKLEIEIRSKFIFSGTKGRVGSKEVLFPHKRFYWGQYVMFSRSFIPSTCLQYLRWVLKIKLLNSLPLRKMQKNRVNEHFFHSFIKTTYFIIPLGLIF